MLEQQQALETIERTLPVLPEHERLAVLMAGIEGLGRPDVCNALQVAPTHPWHRQFEQRAGWPDPQGRSALPLRPREIDPAPPSSR